MKKKVWAERITPNDTKYHLFSTFADNYQLQTKRFSKMIQLTKLIHHRNYFIQDIIVNSWNYNLVMNHEQTAKTKSNQRKGINKFHVNELLTWSEKWGRNCKQLEQQTDTKCRIISLRQWKSHQFSPPSFFSHFSEFFNIDGFWQNKNELLIEPRKTYA